ncbi:hypothetical protein [Streptomyces sp. R08]|uniref:Antitoxin Xre/MbcA/ParS-like toxin-binding domain-containing protein n=1 Tax=Streptomyces sp. R08 TaxID=3238624 RepID=A0AB39LXN9_9ACTN
MTSTEGSAPSAADLWRESVGPFYSANAICEKMGIDHHNLAGLVKGEQILALPTSDHDYIYPVRQFFGEISLEVLPGWPGILRTFGDIDPWIIASWSSAVDPASLEGMSPWEWLQTGGDSDPVILEAREFVGSWKR